MYHHHPCHCEAFMKICHYLTIRLISPIHHSLPYFFNDFGVCFHLLMKVYLFYQVIN